MIKTMSKKNDYRTVRILVQAKDCDRFVVVKISNVCPICKRRRGHILKGFAGTDRWINECGHEDAYNRVYEEACNNGMNPQLEKDLQLAY